MSFIFSNTVHEVIRQRNHYQSYHDRNLNKQRGINAPKQLPNLSIHGITANGTYFFCNIVYKKNLIKRQNISIFNLIEAYANTNERSEHVALKNKIQNTCGEQIDGIALFFSNPNEVYGFVTGNRVKATYGANPKPLQLDDDELFSDSNSQIGLYRDYLVYILEDDDVDIAQHIKQYIDSNHENDEINTDVINAIKYIHTHQDRIQDMRWYLKTAYTKIENPLIQQHVKSVYDALALLDQNDSDIKFKATTLTLQLLHCQDDKKRKSLIADYTKLASDLYGSKIPARMIVGISLFLLTASFLTLCVLASPALPVFLLVIGIGVSSFNILVSGIIGIVGKNEFYNDKAKQKRSIANTFFDAIKTLDNISDDLIPQKIKDPSERTAEGIRWHHSL